MGLGYGGASLSTVTPDPTVYSYGETDTADQISQIAGVAGQWGATIASVVTGNPVAVSPSGQVVGAAGSYQVGAGMSGTTFLVLLAVAGVVLYLVLKD